MGSKFNIVSYGSEFDCMFPQSFDYEDYSLKMASQELKWFDADYGGTEIYAPLEYLMS